MRLSPCHSVPLKFRRFGRRAGHKISLVSCPECGAKYQISEYGVLYQVARKSDLSKSEHVSARLTPARLAEIREKWGSFQRFADEG